MTQPSRRSFLGGFCSCSVLATLALSQSACSTTGASGPEGRIQPGYRPAASTDEEGLWRLMDKTEADLKRSRFLIRDADLNAYVREIACNLSKDHCVDLRSYIVRTPYFNASMMPNGAMQVWTGLLLRTQNEAQLAAVIGHEMGHYLQRHSLQQYRDARAKADFAAFLGMGMAAVGVGALASVSNLMLIASMYSFSRDQEREADAIGIELMSAAGYAPIEASKVWSQMVAEIDADPVKETPAVITATHPQPKERSATLLEKAETMPPGQTYVDRYRAKTLGIRRSLFEDELRLRQFSRSIKLFSIMTQESGEDTLLIYYTGEAYRLRGGDGDAKVALAAYERALSRPDVPPQAYRSLGLLHMNRGDNASAAAAFQEYLKLNPGADDRDMILSYLSKAS